MAPDLLVLGLQGELSVLAYQIANECRLYMLNVNQLIILHLTEEVVCHAVHQMLCGRAKVLFRQHLRP